MSEQTNNVQVEDPSSVAAPVVDTDTTMTDDGPKGDDAMVIDDAKVEHPAANTETSTAPETEVKTGGGDGQTKESGKSGNHYNRKGFYGKSQKKFDPSLVVVDPQNMPGQIRTQVEFYFGDNNLPSDDFLWAQTAGPENRPIPLKTICTFGRMRNFQPYEAVVAALKDSEKLVVSGAEGEEVVARKDAYNVENAKLQFDLEARSIYVKGFGEEKPSTQFDLEAYFCRFDSVEAVRLRRTNTGQFKGSVFVQFQNAEQVKAFLALDPKPEWQGRALEIKSKHDYVVEKNKLIRSGALKPTERGFGGRGRGGRGRGGDRARGGRGGRGRDGRGGGRGNNDSNDWKTRKHHDNRGGRRDRGSNKRTRDDESAAEGEPATKKADTKSEGDAKVDAPANTE